MTANQSTEPKKHLALDTDGLTASLFAVCFVFCLLSIGFTVRNIVAGTPVAEKITWDTVFSFLAFAWLAIRSPERMERFGCGLLSAVFGSRLVLWALHVSTQIQILNAHVMRIVALVVMTGFCLYIAHWFKGRMKQV